MTTSYRRKTTFSSKSSSKSPRFESNGFWLVYFEPRAYLPAHCCHQRVTTLPLASLRSHVALWKQEWSQLPVNFVGGEERNNPPTWRWGVLSGRDVRCWMVKTLNVYHPTLSERLPCLFGTLLIVLTPTRRLKFWWGRQPKVALSKRFETPELKWVSPPKSDYSENILLLKAGQKNRHFNEERAEVK